MAEISHLIADPDTTSKLRACFPDFAHLKEQIKSNLASEEEHFQAICISPEISDVPESTRFFFFFTKGEGSNVSCRAYSYCGESKLFVNYIKTLLSISGSVDLEKVFYLSKSQQILPAQIFSSLSIAELGMVEKKVKEKQVVTTTAAAPVTNMRQYAFVAVVAFAFVYGYTSQRAQLLINKTREAIFDVSSFLDFSEPEFTDEQSGFADARARFVGAEDSLMTLDPNNPQDRLDILMSKLELIENSDDVSPEEIERIEREIDKAFDVLAEAESIGE